MSAPDLLRLAPTETPIDLMRHYKTIAFTLLGSLFLGGGLWAQTQESLIDCDTTLSPGEVAEMRARQASGVYDSGTLGPSGAALLGASGTQFVIPLTFHVVRTTAGQGGLSPARQAQALIDVNLAYSPMGIEFCLVGPVDYIDDDDLYFNIDSSSEIDVLRTTNSVSDTINIYFTEELNNGSSNICGRSSFSTSAVQGIAMKNSCSATPTNASTLAHEIGHYLDLYHTHSSSFGNECVDGSNCATAGDMVCDTPADPRLGSTNVNAACAYVGGESDPCNGQAYAPQTDNFMSYSLKACRDQFTLGQRARALAALVNVRPELAQQLCGAFVTFACDPAQPNSTGASAKLVAVGSGLIASNALTLRVTSLPASQFGYFLNGTAPGAPVVPMGSQGTLCLGGAIGRYNGALEIQNSGPFGLMGLALDLANTPTPGSSVAISTGETWHLQLRYRDWVSGGSTSNFSNALAIQF